ncbi:MAG: lamin tail domain-containing protein [Candidatus Eisenbacteria sp.]|nr:lamin tail domain-containing protein [Candidatus Eisenbacteria bacterium]
MAWHNTPGRARRRLPRSPAPSPRAGIGLALALILNGLLGLPGQAAIVAGAVTEAAGAHGDPASGTHGGAASGVHGGSASGTGVCINEVLYDPVGSDAGYEFVELFNPLRQRVSLAGWRLEAGNGARPGDWRLQWEGGASDGIAAGGVFLIAGQEVAAEADARVSLVLQNGPDAVRLTAPDGGSDCLGWGSHTSAEYYEAQPAPDAPAGTSLARLPDGHDTDSNAADFELRALPTPGMPNATPNALILEGLRCDPPLVDPGGIGTITITLSNAGTAELDFATLHWSLACPGFENLASPSSQGTLAPEASADLTWTLRAQDERGSTSLRIALVRDGEAVGELTGMWRIGRGALVISEILYDPREEEGEWIELWNRSDHPIALSGWRVRDGSGQETTLGAAALPLPAGGCVIVAEDPAALRRVHLCLDEELIAPRQGSWPRLNNQVDRERGYADEVVLCSPDGLAADYVRYVTGDLDGDGVSLERWIEGGMLVDPDVLVPCPAPAGSTPGAAGLSGGGQSGGGSGGFLQPDPVPFYPDREGEQRYCRLRIPAVTPVGGRVSAEVFSLAGRRVATLTAGAKTSGPTILVWDGCSAAGRPLPSGLYLIRAVLHDPASGERAQHVCPLALIRGS